MNYLSFDSHDHGIFVFLLAIYLFGEYWMTYNVATLIYGKYGLVMFVVSILLLFFYAHPTLGILGIFVAYTLVQKAGEMVGYNYISEESKWAPFQDTASIPVTLEQEIIEKRVPSRFAPIYDTRNEAKPLCGDTGNASKYDK